MSFVARGILRHNAKLGNTSRIPMMQSSGLPTKRAIPDVTHIVAVASGKGGVGKSTCAVNLAVALSRLQHPDKGIVSRNLRVGLVDGDVYGPSVPILMNLVGLRAESNAENRLVPLENYGIKCMSMGFLMQDNAAAIWRGPMVSSAIQQLLFVVDWGKLDVLVVDLPPGTGDAQLSLVQNVPLSGAVIVSTPQLVALADVRRAAAMFAKVQTRVLGVIENMSSFECPKCGSVSHIFGHDGAVQEAQRLDVPLLGKVPLSEHVRQLSDDGKPVTVATPDHNASQVFSDIANRVVASIFNTSPR